MEDKKINQWLRRRFSPVGWTFLIYYLIMNIMVIATVVTDLAAQYLEAFAWGDYTMEPDMNAVLGNAWGYVLAMAVGAVILLAWKGGDYWKEEMLKKEAPMKASVFFILLTFIAGAQMVSSLWITAVEAVLNLFDKSALELLESVSGDSDTFSMFFYTAILAPISEEILFRGYVLRTLRPYGKRFSIFGSAFLFGIFHGNLLQTPYAFLAGLVLGYAAAEYSILWAVVLHMFNNLVLADLMTRALELLPTAAADAISLVVFGGFALAAAILLFARRRQIASYRRSEWMDRRCLKCFFGSAGVVVLMVFMAVNMLTLFVM